MRFKIIIIMQTIFRFPKFLLHFAGFNLLICYVHSLVKLPENVTIPAVFTFGDSYVDTGNNNDLHTIVKANFRPNGRDFQGGQPTGRFSNGKVLADILAFHLLICYVRSLLKLPDNVTIPAVFIFGDSIVDTGNNNDLHSIVKANFRPYGRDFQGGQPTGRFSNGKVPSDFLVSELGIKEYLPPYLDPKLQDEDLVTGVCFASAGVGFDPLTPQIVSVKSLVDQLEMFDEYKTRLQKIVGIDRANFIIANSLYIIAAGTNDIVNTYFHLSFRCLQYDLAGYIDLMASSASDFLKKLYDLGARRMAIFGIPSIGCTPSQRTLYGGIERVCADICNRPAQLFNSKAQEIMRHLNRELPDVNIGYMDGYETLLEVIKNKDQYGFKYTDVGCCGTGLYEVSFMCNKYTNVFSCKNASEYLFWDSYHPTERFYRIASQILLPKLITDMFPTANSTANSTDIWT